MRVTLVQIGNSKGIRLPTSILRQCGFGEALDLRVENGSVVLTPAPAVRADWDTAFAAMAAAGDELVLIEDILVNEDKAEPAAILAGRRFRQARPRRSARLALEPL